MLTVDVGGYSGANVSLDAKATLRKSLLNFDTGEESEIWELLLTL